MIHAAPVPASAAPAAPAATTPASSASSSSASPPFPTTKADVFGLDHYRSLLPFSPYPAQSRPPDHEEISTIFVVGFPDDMHEREFQNMFTFSLGFEAATLKIPNKDSSAYAPRQQQPFAPPPAAAAAAAAAQDPYNLVTVNSGGVVVDGPHGTSSSWQQHDHHQLHHLPHAPPRKQIIGFAKFRSRQEALDARDVLQGRRVDIEKGAVLKAEMAKKNLHTKRGVGPLGLPLGLVPPASASALPPDLAPPFSPTDPLSQKDRQLAALGAMGLVTIPRRPDDDKRPEISKDKDALDRERERERNNKLRMNNTTLYDAFHSVPIASSRPAVAPAFADSATAFADSATAFPGYAFQNSSGSFASNGSGLGSNGSSAFAPNGSSTVFPNGSSSAFSPNGNSAFANGTSAFSPNGGSSFAPNGGLNGNSAFAPFPAQQQQQQQPSSAWGLPSKPNSPPPPFLHSPPSSAAGGSQASSIEGEFSRTLTLAVTPPLLHTHLDSHSPTLQHHHSHPSPLTTHPHPHQGMTSPQLPSPGSGGSSSIGTGAGGPKQGGAGNASDQNPPINTLYVGNLPNSPAPAGYPPNYLEESLRVLFARCPGYRKLCFRQKSNGPMCFVEFEDVGFATKALNDLYGNQLNGFVKGGIRLSFSKNPLGVRPAAQGQAQTQIRREWGSPQQVQMQVQQLQLHQQQSQLPQLQQQSQLPQLQQQSQLQQPQLQQQSQLQQQPQLQQPQLQQPQLQQPQLQQPQLQQPQLQQPQLQQPSQLQQPQLQQQQHSQLQQQHSQIPQQPALHHHQQHTGINYASMHDPFHARGPPQQQQGLSLDIGSGRRHDPNANDVGSPGLMYGYATSPPPSRFFSPPPSSTSQSSFATTMPPSSSSAFPRYSQTLGGSQHSPPFFHEGDERVRFRDAPPHAFTPSPGVESTRAG